jgi:hypothetical protein
VSPVKYGLGFYVPEDGILQTKTNSFAMGPQTKYTDRVFLSLMVSLYGEANHNDSTVPQMRNLITLRNREDGDDTTYETLGSK